MSVGGNGTEYNVGRGLVDGNLGGAGGGDPIPPSNVVELPVVSLAKAIVNDLARSGLSIDDMQVRPLDGPEKAASGCNPATPGYVIPYFSASGDMLPNFYRVKVLKPSMEGGAKYKQPRKTPNHVYFPSNFRETLHKWLQQHPGLRTIIITEGEKKATASCKHGIPAVGLGGVDSWRSRTIILPKDTQLSSGGSRGVIKARLPGSDISTPELMQLATGMGDIVDLIVQYKLTAVIIFDSDRLGTLKSEVQRSATMLAYELRFLGIPSSRIKQIVLPEIKYEDRHNSDTKALSQPLTREEAYHNAESSIPELKTGLDDYLIAKGPDPLVKRLAEIYSDPEAFPKHPNPKGYINTQLEGQNTRKEHFQISSVIIAELDARGKRLRDPFTERPYYYDSHSHKLMPAVILDSRGQLLHESSFGTLLYREFGISKNDARVLTWLASQFTGEDPIFSVSPKRVVSLITEKEDPLNPYGIAWQASDSSFFAISPDPKNPIRLETNGTKGILFEQDQVEPLDVDRVLEAFDEYNSQSNLPPWWINTLQDTNMGKTFIGTTDAEGNVQSGGLTDYGKSMRMYAALLYYISPFLNRWRGTQLPVELITGEAGSGKSSLYELRLSVLSGRPRLRNLPTDVRDWQASISNTGGLHVTDNVHFSNRDLKQRLSDEICRIVTEPNPSIEMRRLFTNNDVVKLPVTTTFAFTSIIMPFSNADLMQRAAVFECSAIDKPPDGDWVEKQLERRGGRENWIAHHLVFLHRFLRAASRPPHLGGWNVNFRTEHRLSHLEQCLKLANSVLHLPEQNIGTIIRLSQERGLTEADWVMAGLKAFADVLQFKSQPTRFSVADICEWMLAQTDFSESEILTNSRKLGRYFTQHRMTILKVVGIASAGTLGNKQMYIYKPIPGKKGALPNNTPRHERHDD